MPTDSTRPRSSRLASFRHAGRGLVGLVVTEPNAKIHAVITVAVTVVGFGCRISASDWSLLVLAMTSVWAAEAMNTAVESLTDLTSPERHPLAGRAKDLAAGAVLVTAVGAAVVGIILFGPHVVSWFV